MKIFQDESQIKAWIILFGFLIGVGKGCFNDFVGIDILIYLESYHSNSFFLAKR